jgi:transcriptional regulator with XRE-family HTH domain
MSYFLMNNAKMDIKQIICSNLKALRESTDLNQTKFAIRCGLLQRAYGRIENGESMAHLEMLEQVAKKNDLEVWQLLVPGFNPSNLPLLKLADEAEQKFYEKIGKINNKVKPDVEKKKISVKPLIKKDKATQ